MKRTFLLIWMLLAGSALLTACTPSTGVAQTAAACPEAPPGTTLLAEPELGICFLYPEQYDIRHGEAGNLTLYVDSLLNTEAPLASIVVEPANGRSLDEITAQRLADYAFPDTEAQAITLGGQPAMMLDNLPGQDTNRRIVALHGQTVVDVMIARTGDEYGAVGVQAEALYEVVAGSFQFTSPMR